MTARPTIIHGVTVIQFRVTQYHAPANDRPRLRRALNDNSDGEAA